MFKGYGSELLKHTKYFHTMPKRFFTFRIHAQSVRMAVVGVGLTLGALRKGPIQIISYSVIIEHFSILHNARLE